MNNRVIWAALAEAPKNGQPFWLGTGSGGVMLEAWHWCSDQNDFAGVMSKTTLTALRAQAPFEKFRYAAMVAPKRGADPVSLNDRTEMQRRLDLIREQETAIARLAEELADARADALRLHGDKMAFYEAALTLVHSETIKSVCGWYGEIDAFRKLLGLAADQSATAVEPRPAKLTPQSGQRGSHDA